MPDFESQFKTKKKISFHGHSVSYVDIAPPSLKHSTPIFIAPGWGETPRTFKTLMGLLYDNGYRVISVYHPRHDLKLITRGNISRFELQKADIIAEIIDTEHITKVDVIAHSEGTVNSVIAAHMRPSLFRQLILIGPGGLVERESYPELIGRFMLNMFQGGPSVLWNKNEFTSFIRSFIDMSKYFLSNPMLGLLEGSAVSHAHMQQSLTAIHEAGVAVTIVCGTKDVVFPHKKMKSISALTWIDIRDMAGGHDDICVHPQRYIGLIQEKCVN
ncbi:MAG: alpha/beta hydrolase [Candidatus Pacebacteria bacterium]|nr:alpha/beta hydrolase [Candidatus Paceibacterota bacterium]